MRHLTCVFSYNRPRQLANCIASIEKHFPVGDRVVFDDGSTMTAEMQDVLDEERNPGWRIVQSPHVVGEHGGLWENHRRAMKLALDGGYDSCLFIEDDMQFVRTEHFLLTRVQRVFEECPDASMVSALFPLRVKVFEGEFIDTVKAYRLNRGAGPVGFWNMATVRRWGFVPLDEEAVNSRWWLERGFRTYMDSMPCIGTLAFGTMTLPLMTSEEIKRMAIHPAKSVPYQEHYIPSSLVWYQRDRTRFRELCHQRLHRANRVVHFSEFMPTVMEPEASHLNWKQVETGWRQRIPWPRWMVTLRHFSIRGWLASIRLQRQLEIEQRWVSSNHIH